MNREQYNSDSRYRKVLEQMDLLGIMDITTTRQAKNGTVVWKLPIKNNNNGKTNIEVASFSTGYVRNQNSGYSNYQLNKRCESEPEYYNINPPHQEPLYTKFTTRTCKLIPIEIDRLEYLISYCLKNYYIKRANQVADGGKIRDLEERLNLAHEDLSDVIKNRDYYKDKYKKLNDLYEASSDFNNSMHEGAKDRIKDLENKLDRSEFYPFDLQVLVNGQRYKVI